MKGPGGWCWKDGKKQGKSHPHPSKVNGGISRPLHTQVIIAPLVGPGVGNSKKAFFGPEPQVVECPRCKTKITTKTSQSPSIFAYWACLVMASTIVCLLGCCLIPFCMNDCQQTEHFCPQCNALLGRYNHFC